MKRRIKAWFNDEEYKVLLTAVDTFNLCVDKLNNEKFCIVKQICTQLKDKLWKVEVMDDDDNA